MGYKQKLECSPPFSNTLNLDDSDVMPLFSLSLSFSSLHLAVTSSSLCVRSFRDPGRQRLGGSLTRDLDLRLKHTSSRYPQPSPLTPIYFTFRMISSSPPLFGIHPAMTIRSLIQSYFIVPPFPYPIACSPRGLSFMNHGLCALFIRITFRFLLVGLINSPLVHISSI